MKYWLIVTETDHAHLFLADDAKEAMEMWTDAYNPYGYEGLPDYIIHSVKEIAEKDVENTLNLLHISIEE